MKYNINKEKLKQNNFFQKMVSEKLNFLDKS